MISFAIDMSSHSASLALRRDGHALADHSWKAADHPHPHLFAVLPDFLRDAGVEPDAIAHVVVGVGPGSFAGIRTALAAANGLALPGSVPVHGLSSATAIAWQLMRGEATAAVADRDAAGSGPVNIVVVGDARRGRCWISLHTFSGRKLLAPSIPVLVSVEALTTALPPGACVATADWDRLADRLPQLVPHGTRLVAEPVWPRAADLAELAERHTEIGVALLPPQPLYLHPPVDEAAPALKPGDQ